jgi:hypothetical protein
MINELEGTKLALDLIKSCVCHHHIKAPWLPHVMLTIHFKCPKKNTSERDPTTIVDTIEEHGSHSFWTSPTPLVANLVCGRDCV